MLEKLLEPGDGQQLAVGEAVRESSREVPWRSSYAGWKRTGKGWEGFPAFLLPRMLSGNGSRSTLPVPPAHGEQAQGHWR